jgi:hypothetical protein
MKSREKVMSYRLPLHWAGHEADNVFHVGSVQNLFILLQRLLSYCCLLL